MTSSSCRGGYSRGAGGVAHLLMSSNRACFMSAIDMVRSDSSAIAICISQATNFPQILTRLSALSSSLSLLSHSPSSCTFVCDFVGLHMFSIDPFSLLQMRKFIIVPISVGAGNAMQQKHMQYNVNKVHVAFILLLFYFSVCCFFSLIFRIRIRIPLNCVQ